MGHMAEDFEENRRSFVGLAKRQLHRLSERAIFLAPVASIADTSWRILLLVYASGKVEGGIPPAWEKELNIPAHTLQRYLAILGMHGFIRISGGDCRSANSIELTPEKKRNMDELLSQTAYSGELFPDSSDFG